MITKKSFTFKYDNALSFHNVVVYTLV